MNPPTLLRTHALATILGLALVVLAPPPVAATGHHDWVGDLFPATVPPHCDPNTFYPGVVWGFEDAFRYDIPTFWDAGFVIQPLFGAYAHVWLVDYDGWFYYYHVVGVLGEFCDAFPEVPFPVDPFPEPQE